MRLNGGGHGSARGGSGGGSANLGSRLELPLPVSARAERVHAIAALSRSIDGLEQKLQEASKVGHFLLNSICCLICIRGASAWALLASHCFAAAHE